MIREVYKEGEKLEESEVTFEINRLNLTDDKGRVLVDLKWVVTVNDNRQWCFKDLTSVTSFLMAYPDIEFGYFQTCEMR